MAKKQGLVSKRGKPSIEFHKNGVPQYYCYGYIDTMTDELFEVCRNCADYVDRAYEDYEKWKSERKEPKINEAIEIVKSGGTG